jgi:hypothetical protein
MALFQLQGLYNVEWDVKMVMNGIYASFWKQMNEIY